MSVPKSPQTTRARILSYLSEHPTASVQDLSRACRLTPADIRYHLAGLLRAGLVERAPGAQPADSPGSRTAAAKRGRPAVHYRLAPAGAGESYPALCSALLTVLSSAGEEALRQAATMMAGESIPAELAGAPAVQRLNAGVQILRQQGYRARWEASAGGPRILLRGCPYAAILERHPELCRLDLHLLQALTGLHFQQVVRLNPQTGTPPACVFSASPGDLTR